MSSSSSKLHLPADDSVLLLLTHSNLSTFSSDIRVSKQTSVESLKEKLWRKTGTSVASMRLQLHDDTGAMIADLDNDDATLASYSPYDGLLTASAFLFLRPLPTALPSHSIISLGTVCTLSISILPQSPPVVGWRILPLLKSTPSQTKHIISLIQTFENSKKRWPLKTLRQMINNNLTSMWRNCAPTSRAEALGRGFWVGVQYDEPLGKHDGMVKGIRFFECPQGHGAIVRPEKVKVGDYPERDPFEEEI